MNIKDTQSQTRFTPQQTILWYSVAVGGIVAAIVAIIMFSIESQGRSHINRLTQSTANGIALLIEDDLQNRLDSLTELAKLSQFTSSMTDEDWHSMSKTLYETHKGYQAIGWVDSDYHIRRVVPIEGNEVAQDFNLALNPPALKGAIKAQQQNAAAVTLPFDSIHGGAGLGMYVPVFDTSQAEKILKGFMTGLLLFDVYVNSVLPSYLLLDHQFTLYIDDQAIYSDKIQTTTNDSNWRRQASFDFQGQIWKLSILPKSTFLNQSHYTLMRFLFVLGVVLTLCFAFAAYTALIARNKTRVIKDDRNKVAHLLKNLPGMAYQSFNTSHWPMILVSEGCETLTGYLKSEFESQSVLWGKIIHPEDYERVYRAINYAVVHKTLFEIEYRILTKNQSVRLVWERGESVSSTLNDEAILEGFVTDITNVKEAEWELLHSHAFSAAIVNSVVEAIITIDHNGHIKSFNKAAQEIFGYTFDEIKHKNITLLMPPNDAMHHRQYVADYLRTNQAHIIGRGRELEARRKDGSVFPVHISVNEIQNHEDRMFVGLIRDITQQRAIEDQKRKYTEQMAHADRLNSLGEMAAGIAHEVNQPLTAISLFSQSGKSLCNSGKFDRLPDIFEKLSQHSRRAGAVLERMQMMTRQGERTKELVDCNTVIDEVLKLAESDARIRNISIKVSRSKTGAKTHIDRVQIQQVLLNLLRNGMQAMQSADLAHGCVIELKAELTAYQSIKISVADSGCGVDTSMTGRLFTPFASTKKDGMGIGLSISKSIVEEHGGSIHYVKNAPTGSVFYFILPIAEQ